MNYVAVIQGKHRSALFPGRSLVSLGNQSVLQYLVEYLKRSKVLSHIILATTQEPEDDSLAEAARGMGISVFRGDGSDVLGRIYSASLPYVPDGVVKILGNAPLLDLGEMEKLVIAHHQNGYDYSYNEHVNGVIYGMGCSVFSFDVLTRLLHEPLTAEQREIGSLYIRQHADKYKILKLGTDFNRPHYRVLIDIQKDVDLLKSILHFVPDITNRTVGEFLDGNPLLVDYQNGSGISETGLEKLFLFPTKVQAYMHAGDDLSYPVSVELSLTNRCNFDCVWCSDSALRERLGGEFTLKELEAIFQDLKNGGTVGVVIEGGGEPTIHPDFVGVVRAAHAVGLSIGLITNGSVALPAELIPLFEWIRVSLDASTPEQHERGKKVKLFEKVMRNIKHIGQHKGQTTLGIGYVVTRDNVDNLENLLLRLRLYSVDYIQFRPVIDTPDLSSHVNLAYLKKYDIPSFKVDIQAMYANKETGNGGKPCFAHSLSSVITADGGVYLCGRLNIYDWVQPIGNLHQQSFGEIWNGTERKRQMEQVSTPLFCEKHCPECRMTKYNLLADRIRSFKTKNFI